MNKLALMTLLNLMLLQAVQAAEVRAVKSPPNKVAMVELYTSEGCSSCPPADRWLSRLRDSGVRSDSIIPLAFHVTYWDYIGWKDRFGMEDYDLRQRHLGRVNSLRTIYTPQFVVDGKDFRRYRGFADQVSEINAEPAEVDLTLTLTPRGDDAYSLDVMADTSRSSTSDVALFIAVVESNLVTDVDDGENEGERLKHDYVVRALHGPEFVSRPAVEGTLEVPVELAADWKPADMDIVGFAQNLRTGEILQAVSMPLTQRDQVSLNR